MPILKLKEHDEESQIQFELDYLTSLTTRQRFEMMFAKNAELLALLKKSHGHRTTTEIIKRK